MIDIVHEANSSDQNLNGVDYSEFDVEHDGIRDQEYHSIKIVSIAGNISPYIM